MQRLLLIVLVSFVLILFAWGNTHHVEVGLVFGRPVHVRLVFLLLTTFLLGHLSAVLMNVYLRARVRAKVRREKLAEDARGDDEDRFFLE